MKGPAMARPITLSTGQWADLPFADVAQLASSRGYDGWEIARWGDHLDPNRGATDDAHLGHKRAARLGAPDALRCVRGKLFDAPSATFDAAFSASGAS